MIRCAATLLGVLALTAFSPADPPAQQQEAATLPCARPGNPVKTSKEFGEPYNAARQLILEKRFSEALELTRAAYSRATHQTEALAVTQLETAAYAGLGDQGWILWSLREQLRINELCPGVLPELTASAHRLTILGLEDELSRRPK